MWEKVGKVPDSEKNKICFKIVRFKRFGRKIVTSKQVGKVSGSEKIKICS